MGVGCHGSHDYLQRSTLVNSEKYIGLDVHQATIMVAVMDSSGKLVMESILEMKAATILQFFAGLRGTLWVTFEEGTCAAWLYDLLEAHVAQLVVCNPRKNALLKYGNKSDRIDARKLAELLRGNHLKAVYHGENGVRTLRELARSYLTTIKDLTRVSATFVPGLSRCQEQQFFPRQVQIHQRAHREQLGGILLQSAKAQLHKSELQLHHRKHVFHLRAHPRLRPVLRPLHFVNTILVAVAPMGAVLGLRRALPDHFALSAISLIAPHPRFLAVQ